MADEVATLNASANSEFDKAQFRIDFLTKQRNEALNVVVITQEKLEIAQLELRKAYARISELLPIIAPPSSVVKDNATHEEPANDTEENASA